MNADSPEYEYLRAERGEGGPPEWISAGAMTGSWRRPLLPTAAWVRVDLRRFEHIEDDERWMWTIYGAGVLWVDQCGYASNALDCMRDADATMLPLVDAHEARLREFLASADTAEEPSDLPNERSES